MQTSFSNDSAAFGHDGIDDCSSASQAVENAGVSVVGPVSTTMHVKPPPKDGGDNTVLHVSSTTLDRTQSASSGFAHRVGSFSQGSLNRCLPAGVGGSVRGCISERSLGPSTARASHQSV